MGIRQNVFKAVFNLLDTNKPSGWNIRASLNNYDSTFPTLVVNKALVEDERDTHGKATGAKNVSIVIEVVTHIKSAPEKMDEGKDNVHETLTADSSFNSLYTSNDLTFVSLTDIGEAERDINGQMYRSSRMVLRLLKA